jgi:hypothetical protein
VCVASQNIDYDKRQRLQELAKAKKRLSKVEVIMKRQIIQNQPEQVCLPSFPSLRARGGRRMPCAPSRSDHSSFDRAEACVVFKAP